MLSRGSAGSGVRGGEEKTDVWSRRPGFVSGLLPESGTQKLQLRRGRSLGRGRTWVACEALFGISVLERRNPHLHRVLPESIAALGGSIATAACTCFAGDLRVPSTLPGTKLKKIERRGLDPVWSWKA